MTGTSSCPSPRRGRSAPAHEGIVLWALDAVQRETLSLLASLQIMNNDMIHIGDGVEMPQSLANGDGVDIALYTMNIQN